MEGHVECEPLARGMPVAPGAASSLGRGQGTRRLGVPAAPSRVTVRLAGQTHRFAEARHGSGPCWRVSTATRAPHESDSFRGPPRTGRRVSPPRGMVRHPRSSRGRAFLSTNAGKHQTVIQATCPRILSKPNATVVHLQDKVPRWHCAFPPNIAPDSTTLQWISPTKFTLTND
jgi:hypothetical protein